MIHLGPPVDELGRAAGQMAEKGVEAAAGLFNGAASLVERTADYLSDFIALPPPPIHASWITAISAFSELLRASKKRREVATLAEFRDAQL